MKKLILSVILFGFIFVLTACDDKETDQLIKNATEALISAQGQIAALQELNDTLEDQVDVLLKSIDEDTCNEDLISARNEIANLLGNIENYTTQIASLQENNNQMQTNYETLYDSYQELSGLYYQIVGEYTDLLNQHNLLVAEANRLEALIDSSNIQSFMHINGLGYEQVYPFTIQFEYEVETYVKYQITYLSCNCREADSNYSQVAYVEINKTTNDIKFLSFNQDSAAMYTPGTWGDSNPTPSGKTYTDFETDFIPWLVGKSLDDLEGISVFTNASYHGIENTTTITDTDLIDDFAGSSVSTNNMIRVIKELLLYHETTYTS